MKKWVIGSAAGLVMLAGVGVAVASAGGDNTGGVEIRPAVRLEQPPPVTVATLPAPTTVVTEPASPDPEPTPAPGSTPAPGPQPGPTPEPEAEPAPEPVPEAESGFCQTRPESPLCQNPGVVQPSPEPPPPGP